MSTPPVSAESSLLRKTAIEDVLREGYVPFRESGGKGSSVQEAAKRLGMASPTLANWITTQQRKKAAGETSYEPDWTLYKAPLRQVVESRALVVVHNPARRWLLTAAQDDTAVHWPFWNNLNTYARDIGAEVMVGGFTYQKGLFEDHASRSAVFAEALRPYLQHDNVECGPLLFAAKMNSLPTAVRPLSGLDTYSRGRWAVFPHAKIRVVEINPNYNDAKRFANRHKGKVFICDSFGKVAEGMIQWGDAPKLDTSDRRTSDEERDRYTLRMDQYKCMQVSMARITATQCLFPDRNGLVQEVKEKGQVFEAAVLPRAFFHFTKTALVAEKDDETNQFKRSVRKVGVDPHFSYANMLCDVAWARAYGTASFILPDAGGDDVTDQKQEEVRAALPGLPSHVVQMVQSAPADSCGSCAAFSDGRCSFRNVLVALADPACDFYESTE